MLPCLSASGRSANISRTPTETDARMPASITMTASSYSYCSMCVNHSRVVLCPMALRQCCRQCTSSRLTVAAPSCSTRYAAMVPPHSARCAVSSGSTLCCHICAGSGQVSWAKPRRPPAVSGLQTMIEQLLSGADRGERHLEDKEQMDQRVQLAVPQERLLDDFVRPRSHARIYSSGQPLQSVLLRVPRVAFDLHSHRTLRSLAELDHRNQNQGAGQPGHWHGLSTYMQVPARACLLLARQIIAHHSSKCTVDCMPARQGAPQAPPPCCPCLPWLRPPAAGWGTLGQRRSGP